MKTEGVTIRREPETDRSPRLGSGRVLRVLMNPPGLPVRAPRPAYSDVITETKPTTWAGERRGLRVGHMLGFTF